MTVVVRCLVTPCFASCTDESETWKTEKGSAKDLGERFGTSTLKATNSQSALRTNLETVPRAREGEVPAVQAQSFRTNSDSRNAFICAIVQNIR